MRCAHMSGGYLKTLIPVYVIGPIVLCCQIDKWSMKIGIISSINTMYF
jgi:hypothetical protein